MSRMSKGNAVLSFSTVSRHSMAPTLHTSGAPASTSVAIIGGGAAGLVCGSKLKQLGVKHVVVFDTGKHAPGGRMSSRDIMVPAPGNPGQRLTMRVDHSAQLLTATTPRFQRTLEGWAAQQLVLPYQAGDVGTVDATTGSFTPRARNLPRVFYPPKGMRSVAQHLATGLDVQLPMWVGRVQRRDPSPGAPVLWDVFGERNRHLGAFNYLVVAHNGKCADRLMSTADAPGVHQLLRTQFRPQATPQQVMQMCSLWMGVVVLPSSLNLPFKAAFVEHDSVLSFMSNNSARIIMNSSAAPLEAWTLFSTRQYAADNKVPQEAIPPAKQRQVKSDFLDAVARVTKQPREALKPVFEKLQLWGAAVPLNHTNTACVLDVDTQCGICGDWLVAPSIEGAALSGEALAENIVAHASGQLASSVGLGQIRFNPFASATIGQIRGAKPAASTSGEGRSARQGGNGGRPQHGPKSQSVGTNGRFGAQQGHQRAGSVGQQSSNTHDSTGSSAGVRKGSGGTRNLNGNGPLPGSQQAPAVQQGGRVQLNTGSSAGVSEGLRRPVRPQPQHVR